MLYLKEINYDMISASKILLVLSLISFIALIFCAVIRYKSNNKVGVKSFSAFAIFTVGLLMNVFLVDASKYKYTSIPLSAIDNKISVKGQRVDIGKLDDKYEYKDFKKDNESVTMSSDSHTFKFEYDEVFESGKLSDEYGRYQMLDKGDIDYLRSKQVKGEK